MAYKNLADQAAYARRWRANNRERARANAKRHAQKPATLKYRREWEARRRAANPVRQWLRDLRNSARRAGVAFNLTEADLQIPRLCPVLNIPLASFGTAIGNCAARPDNYPTADRTIPALGYVRGNVKIMSWRANRLKSDGSAGEFAMLVRYLQQA